jgi:hypothetical protein
MNLEALNRKVGGLPVWVWAAISVIVLYLGYKWYENRSGGSGSSSPLVVATPQPQSRT